MPYKMNNETALERYYRMKGKAQTEDNYKSVAKTASTQPQIQAEEETNKGGFFGGLGYVLENVGLGALRTIEGIWDYTAGGIADLFGNDDYADELMKSDWVNYSHADEWYNPTGAMQFVSDVAEGVGGMLPSVALSFVPGVGGALSATSFGLGAAGQSVSEQTKKNGTASGKEWLYGTASGAMETAIEAISGGIGGTKAGKVLGKQLAKTTGGKIATTFVSEGLEEVASDLVDPALKRITGVDKEASVDISNLPRTFFVGGTTGAVMGGGSRVLNAARVGGFNNLNAAENTQEMEMRLSDNNVRQVQGKKTIYTQEDINNARDRLSKNLQKMDEGTRASFLERNKRIAAFFNEDGTVKQSVWENKANTDLGANTYSASLKGRESELKYQPVAAGTPANEAAQKAMKNIELMTGGKTDIVLTTEKLATGDGREANGVYADGVLYLNANADSYERAMFVASHEMVHTLEGTKEYARLGEFIKETIKSDSALAEKYNVEKYLAAYEGAQQSDFSAETREYEATTEMHADFIAKEILSNEDTVKRLINRDRNIVVRMLDWVRSAIKRMGMSKEERAEYTTLKRAEKLLAAAIETSTGGVSLEEVEGNVQTLKALEGMQAAESENEETTEENSVAVGAPATARYSIQNIDGKDIVVIDTAQDIFEGKEKSEYPKIVRQYMLGRYRGKVLEVGDSRAYINKDGISEYAFPANRRMDENIKVAKMKAGTELHNLLKTAEFVAHENDDGRHPEATRGWDKYKTQFIVDGHMFDGEVSIELMDRGNLFYDVSKIKDITPGTNGKDLLSQSASRQSDVLEGNPSTTIIRENSEKSTENAKKDKNNSSERFSIDVDEASKTKKEVDDAALLRRYVHRLDLSEDMKAHAVELYGEKIARRMFNVWENTTGRPGVDIATAHRELAREGFSTYAHYEADFLHDMDAVLRERAPKVYTAVEKGKDITSVNEELTNKQIEHLANYTKKKVYTKQESEIIINEIIEGYMNYEDEIGSMSGKTREEVVKMLWRGMNSAAPGQRAKIAMKVADYIIQHTVMENIYRDSIVKMHTDTIEVLKPYLHKLNLDGIKGNLKHHYDDNSPYLRWGKRKGEKGIGINVAAMELEELGFYIDSVNNVDIFLQIDEAYRKAVEGLKQKTTKFVNEIIGKEEQKALKQDISKALLRAFEQHGTPSELTKTLREYDKRVQGWKDKYYEERDRNNLTARVLYKAQRLKDLQMGTFLNASEFKRDIFKSSIGKLGRIKYRGNLNKSGTRKILSGLLEWYDTKNPLLEGEAYNEDVAQKLLMLADNYKPMTEKQYNLLAELEEKAKTSDFVKLCDWYTKENLGKNYNAGVKEWLKDLSDPTEFSSEELKALENVIDYFKNFVEKHNKIYRGGKLVEAKPIAERYIAQMKKLKRTKIGWLHKWFEKYLNSFGDPMTVARYYDKYENGFFTEMLEELRKGAIAAQVMENSIHAPLEEFYKKHKNFLKESENRTVKYQGEQMSVQQAMLLYMTLKRDQSLRGLAYSGFKFKRGIETVTVRGFANAEALDMDEIRIQAAEMQNELVKQFDEAEREYISIVEKIFNEDCKKAKSDTDMARMGYTNISDDYYVPIRRASIAYNVEKWSYRDELASVSDFSFNKDTVSGAKNQLFIDSLTGVLDKHINGISQYSSLAQALDSYNVLFNMNISGNPNMAVSVKSEGENVWSDGAKYFSELIDDIKGIAKTQGVGRRFISSIRSGYAKYQLGANPKVWVTQLSSFVAATNILDVSSIMKGLSVRVKGDELDSYCGLAKVRNSENTAALAQGVMEKTGRIGDILMKPIGAVDRFVVTRLFGACQAQIEKNGGGKIGTKDNMEKAGELLERVILETQQNALATEKSAAMRSGSEFMKMLTMFSADSMKLTGRVVDSIGEASVLRARLRVETDVQVISELKGKLKTANKKACRAVASIIVSAICMTAIAELFKWLYNKDDEEEDKTTAIVTDTIGNMLGGLPIIRDVYSFFDDGYELENCTYSTINDLLTSLSDASDVATAIISGKRLDSQDVALTIRKGVYAAGQLFGIPTRNIYNVFYGLIKRISPTTAYKINNAFYSQAYRTDLAKAIEKGDEGMISTIVGIMLNENIGGITASDVRQAIDALVKNGYDVIPRSVPDKISYIEDGESREVELLNKQKTQFEKVYFTANKQVETLVKSSKYKNASEEVQAKAVKFIYDTYYELAKEDLLDTGEISKNALFIEAIDIEKLAIILATAKTLTADTDKKGVTISGSRKTKIQKYVNSLQLTAVQKYMIMGYLGYTNKNGAAQVKAYINRLDLSKAEKEALYAYSGYGE